MQNVEAPDLSIVHTFLFLGTKKASIQQKKLLKEKLGSRMGPLCGVATNLRAVHLSIV